MSYYQDRWKRYRDNCDESECDAFAQEVALTFLDCFYFNDRFESGHIRILCEMATAGHAVLQKAGASALFGIVVESLCDDFEDLQSEAYNRLMCEILTFCRDLPGSEKLDERMNRFGMHNFGDLHRRVERLRKTSYNFRRLPGRVDKVVFLSRVTIGADVAVTSVMMQRFARLYPKAELVIIGGGKCDALFGGNPRVRIRRVSYIRNDGLMQRLASWFDVLEAIDEEAGTSASLVVDTDSRLSQLGVLPIFNDDAYLFFNSRSSLGNHGGFSISEMSNHWLTQVTANSDFCYPAIWLDSVVLTTARELCEKLRRAGAHKLVAINLGVGGNTRKRVGDAFETQLVLDILAVPGTVILLDKGVGDSERQQALKLLNTAHAAGNKTADCRFGETPFDRIVDANLIALESSIDEAAALIGSCDEFIGYDSACQHLAAALETPTYTIFAGSNNTRFVRRWRPYGLGKREIIHVDTLTHPPIYNQQAILQRLMRVRQG